MQCESIDTDDNLIHVRGTAHWDGDELSISDVEMIGIKPERAEEDEEADDDEDEEKEDEEKEKEEEEEELADLTVSDIELDDEDNNCLEEDLEVEEADEE